MFQYNMWIISNGGRYFGHEPVSDQEYEDGLRSPHSAGARIIAGVRDAVRRSLAPTVANYPEGLVDARQLLISESLKFSEYNGIISSSLTVIFNHVPPDIISNQQRMIKELLSYAPASYGAIYMFSEDESPFDGRFISIKFVRDEIEIGRDRFFDTHLPKG